MATPYPPHSSQEGDNFEMIVDYYLDMDGTDAKPGPMDPAIRRRLWRPTAKTSRSLSRGPNVSKRS